MPSGRPPKWTNPKKLSKAVDAYFEIDDKPTLSGLAYHLGLSRQGLYEYKAKDAFSDILKKARDRIITIYEKRLIYKPNPTGVIFALKNMGWRDKQELEVDGNLQVSLTTYQSLKPKKDE